MYFVERSEISVMTGTTNAGFHGKSASSPGCGSSFAMQPEHRLTVAPPEFSRNYLLATFLYLRELGRAAGPRRI